jgi:hypothetical protein
MRHVSEDDGAFPHESARGDRPVLRVVNSRTGGAGAGPAAGGLLRLRWSGLRNDPGQKQPCQESGNKTR